MRYAATDDRTVRAGAPEEDREFVIGHLAAGVRADPERRKRDDARAVRQFAQRIEVDNPGGLPPDVTIENILERQSPRNRRIADIFSKCGLVERSGQGMDLIYSRSIRQAKALPDFSGTDRLHVKVTHCGLVEDPALVAMMAKIGRETLRGFSVRDLLVVHNIRKGIPVPTKIWLTKSGGVLLENNNSRIPTHTLRNIMDAIEAQHAQVCMRWLKHFEEISFYC